MGSSCYRVQVCNIGLGSFDFCLYNIDCIYTILQAVIQLFGGVQQSIGGRLVAECSVLDGDRLV